MSSLGRKLVKVSRAVAASNPVTAKMIKKQQAKPRIETGDGFTMVSGRSFRLVRSAHDPDAKRVGIYLRGACDLPALLTMAPMLAPDVAGTVAIFRDPIMISGSRSDVLLQSLDIRDRAPAEALQEVNRTLKLGRRYFSPEFFNPTFQLRTDSGVETFDKTVIALSTAPDFSRTMYRHRQHGFMVDPGGFWLNHSIDNALQDMDTVRWFNKEFEGIGRFTPTDFEESFTRLILETKARTGAHLLVINMLTIDPSYPIHNYRYVKEADNARRRDFTIRLAEMSQKHDFDILDVDRILKLGGVDDQVDFAHFSQEQFKPIGAEALRVLRARGIVS